jgi:hypothetical protein
VRSTAVQSVVAHSKAQHCIAGKSRAPQCSAKHGNALEILASSPFRWALGWNFHLMQGTAKKRTAWQCNAMHSSEAHRNAQHRNALGFQPRASTGGSWVGFPPNAEHGNAKHGRAGRCKAQQRIAGHRKAVLFLTNTGHLHHDF